ncbi:fimbria/pilus periplasmic chaperone [Scandinavium goeteborgense]|uniref:fimbria/pilus periplasmic chaperone n=1 Tax=Scandinavium goeteborgense TaxID=1851514 RepID=UPI00381D6218
MFYKKILMAMTLCIACQSALSSMTISGTRIIFPGNEKEVSIRTNNKGSTPPLVQVWVDDGSTNADMNTMKIPFLVTPPVYRVEPGKGQMVRLIYNGMPLPQDKESIYWFNMLEIPPVDKSQINTPNKLELAFRTRIKIFYRPQTLKSSGAMQMDKLQWTLIDDAKKGRGVKVINPTPYYISFDGGSFKSGGKEYALDLDMLAPGTSYEIYTSKGLAAGTAVQKINFRVLNDFGAMREGYLVEQVGKGWVIAEEKNSNP